MREVIFMIKSNPLQIKNPAHNWILWGILILSIVGSIMHFVYEWSGNSTLVGIFAPINESVWEHLKLTFWPMLIWWVIGYFIYYKRNGIPVVQWFVSCTVAQLVCPLVILSFYYIYIGALGIESLMLDIFSLYLGVAAGQVFALHIYRYAELKLCWLFGAIIVLIILATAFIVFTFVPPHVPLFMDSLTGKYGI
jgi:hypothetical protein